MAKKEDQPKTATPAPVTLKTIKLSTAETSYIQGLNAQKQELDKQIMASVQSILETRDISQTDIVGGLSFTEDLKSLTLTVKNNQVPQAAQAETNSETF